MFLSEVGAPMPSPVVYRLPPPTGPTDPRNAAFHLTPSLRPRLRDAAPHTPCYAFRVSLDFLSIAVQYASWALSNGRQLHHRRCIMSLRRISILPVSRRPVPRAARASSKWFIPHYVSAYISVCMQYRQVGWGIGSIGLTEDWPVNWLNWMVDQSHDQSKITLLETQKWHIYLKDAKISWNLKSFQEIQICSFTHRIFIDQKFGNIPHHKKLISCPKLIKIGVFCLRFPWLVKMALTGKPVKKFC